MPQLLRSSLLALESHLRCWLTPSALPDQSLLKGPVVVSGLLNDSRGIGRAARLTVEVLKSRGYEVIPHDVSHIIRAVASRKPTPKVFGGSWIIQLNPPQIERVLLRCTDLARAPIKRIGYWAWETTAAPPEWRRSAQLLHEIWAPSGITRDALSTLHAHVQLMPHPVSAFDSAVPNRERFGLNATTIVFLAIADVRSSLDRKNPVGAITAFQRAFARDDPSVSLIVKLQGTDSINGRLRQAAADDERILFITETLDDSEIASLVVSADIVVSLHRAEGFGLVIAEALAQSVPVIATGWSGVVDIFPADALIKIPFQMVAVSDQSHIYDAAGAEWAEPDLDAAAAAMRHLAVSAETRKTLGGAGRRAVEVLRTYWDAGCLANRLGNPILAS